MTITQHEMAPSETTRLEPARFPPSGDLSAHGRPVTDPTALPDTVQALLTGGAS